MIRKSLLTLTALFAASAATDYKTPPEVLYPSQYTTWGKSSGDSKVGQIDIPFVNAQGEQDRVFMYRLDLVGSTDYDRGFAHGALLSREIVEFIEVALPKYYLEIIFSLDIR